MELPQPRPFGSEGRKPTHDFLSLYSPVQQDPRSPQGGHLKTHDLLQPLERVGTNETKEENKVEIATIEKPSPTAPPAAGEHLLPGGLGTYTISYSNPKVPKAEGNIFNVVQASSNDRTDENSNCSSYMESGFTLWEESAMKKGKTGKENTTVDRHAMRDTGRKIGGQCVSSSGHPSQPFPNHNHLNNTFSSLSSSQPPPVQKSQSFMDMIKSAKCGQEDDDDDDDFVIKKEPASQPKVKVDGKTSDQKVNTPRSKHSATEQRRRSKINDRLQMLRGLIPNSDQRRDRASFLLEVIEYIQFLQEKVQKYEGTYQGWNRDGPKLMPWRNSQRPAESFVEQSRGTSSGSGPVLSFPAKFEENNISESPVVPRSGQNAVELDMSTATAFKGMDHHSGLANKGVPFPVPLQPNIFPPGGTCGPQILHRLASDTNNTASQPSSQLWQSKSCTTDCAFAGDKLTEQELTIESGIISISTVYSQGLLNTLTQALQSSGVDLTQASMSVQINLGKRANSRLNSSASTVKDDDVPSSNQVMTRSRVASTGEECDRALKRLKTSRS